jgi:ubiquinone/menaquinone biosynthesis C-methylase UbiE
MRSWPAKVRTTWRRIVAFAFRLLYQELAWSYDLVSWTASRGLWRAWQQVALVHLPLGGRVLEVGCGPGHVLVELSVRGYHPAGLDASTFMLDLARRRLHRRGLNGILCHGYAQTLPFAPAAFDAVLATFPTAFVYHPAWIQHVVRVLKPGGRLIVIEVATFTSLDPLSRFLEWLYRVTGQRGSPVDLAVLLREAGLDAQQRSVELQSSRVSFVLAVKNHKVPQSI